MPSAFADLLDADGACHVQAAGGVVENFEASAPSGISPATSSSNKSLLA